MLNVNTIEYEGRRACINSYSDHPALIKSMIDQRERWAAAYPRATVRTERMSEADTIALVAAADRKPLENSAYEIGQASLKG